MRWRGGAFAALACLAACATPEAPPTHPLATSAPIWCGRERCFGAFYRSEQLEFGRYLIGEAVTPAAAAVVEGDCARRRAADCVFVADGVRYAVLRGRVREMRIDLNAPTAQLPFGLHGDETPEAALAAIRRVTDVPMEISGREDGDHTVTVQGSLKNALGEPEWFNLVFTPERRLYVIEMYGVR